MLIETPYKNGDTVSLKLTSGEELVARLEEETDNYYTLKKPMVLIAGQEGLGLAPYMFSVNPNNKFMLRVNSVSCVSKTQEEIAKQYTQQTTGIQMV